MALTNFVPEIWSKELNLGYRNESVGLQTVNEDYTGDIKEGGDTVRINRPAAITVGTYVPDTNITVQTPTSTQLSLVIDQFKYVAFNVDDVRRVQANIELMGPYIDEANYQVSDVVDAYILGRYADADAANVIAKDTVTSSNIYAKLTEAKRRLSASKAPSRGRWMVLDPLEIEKLENASQFQKASALGDDVSRNGFAGRAAGFDIYESNNLTTANDGTDDVRHAIFGHSSATTFAFQFAQMQAGPRELQFGTLVKGLVLYGMKTLKPKGIGDFRIIA